MKLTEEILTDYFYRMHPNENKLPYKNNILVNIEETDIGFRWIYHHWYSPTKKYYFKESKKEVYNYIKFKREQKIDSIIL